LEWQAWLGKDGPKDSTSPDLTTGYPLQKLAKLTLSISTTTKMTSVKSRFTFLYSS